MINTLKVLMEKEDSREDQMGNFSTEIEILGKNQMQVIENFLK